MKNYSKSLTPKSQQEKHPLFPQQVKNSAGGYSFQILDFEKLERFLFCGTEGGTYYADEKTLTIDSAKTVVNLCKTVPVDVFVKTLDAVKGKKLLRLDTAIFVMGCLIKYSNMSGVNRMVYDAILDFCPTATHLFMFLETVKTLNGSIGSSGLKRALKKWYTEKKNIDYQIVKYRNRNGWTHRDVLRLAHIKPSSDEMKRILGYAAGKVSAEESGSSLALGFAKAQDTSLTPKGLAEVIEQYKLTWEMVPTERLNDKDVLEALLENMPVIAVTRNLNRYSINGMTDSNMQAATIKIRAKINSDLASKMHPLNIANSMKVYSSGHGVKGNKTWSPNQSIVEAMNNAAEVSFPYVTATNKKILFSLDVSGSMNAKTSGLELSAAEAGAAMLYTRYKTEQNTDFVIFDTQLKSVNFQASASLQGTMKEIANIHGGGTDCTLPLQHAINMAKKGVVYDVIEIYTDNETWAGKHHSVDLLNKLKAINPNIKIVEVCMVNNAYTNLPEDKNLLRVSGFNASCPEVINKFITG